MNTTWIKKTGEVVKIKDMTDTHILNSYRMIKAKEKDLLEEIKIRKLDPDKYNQFSNKNLIDDLNIIFGV